VFVSGEMMTKGLSSQQSAAEAVGDAPRTHIYVPDYTVEAVTNLLMVRVSVEQYAGALHAASLDRHLRAVDSRGDGRTSAGGHDGDLTPGEFPTSSDAPSPLVEYEGHDNLLDSEFSDDAAKDRNLVNNQTKSCGV